MVTGKCLAAFAVKFCLIGDAFRLTLEYQFLAFDFSKIFTNFYH